MPYKENYFYIDKDGFYTDPNTGVLKNKEYITDANLLIAVESVKSGKRLQELAKSPIKITDHTALFAIHKYLFGDMYDWAGQQRIVEISKGDNHFLPTHFFDNSFAYLDALILDYEKIDSANKTAIAESLADILDIVNKLHPFREGNGRTQREFIRTLASQKGYGLNLNPIDDAHIYDRYMSGTINGDIKILTDLIWNC
ncbi:MAG: Fic family protein [Rickettsiales bacterium]|jgi:cell filamentation protein|nr:Fic family protein [Rickettsiales bacterium]